MAHKIRYGIIGTGMMGCEHIRNIRLLPDVEITAIADPVETSLKWAEANLGDWRPARYRTAAELAESAEVDAVVIASPNNTHREVLEPLFGRDIAILCEKPLATTIPDAQWIVAQAAKSAAPFWTGMEYRYMPPVARFIDQVHGGRVDRLHMLAMREHRFPFLVKVGDWNRFSRNTGGTMVEKCCHFFDLMRLITQSEAVRVYCSGAMDVNHLDERYDGETPDIIDNSYTVVDFANGVRALLDLDKADVSPPELMTAILKAPVDLMWFGGIGTYIKASSESNGDVGDRANDASRVNGQDVRAKVIGEGANLGVTQAGRIEFASHGGRLNTDFIDNSAGVDTSDHEVNIKIALGAATRAGRRPPSGALSSTQPPPASRRTRQMSRSPALARSLA